jgi:ribosome recycling factor
MDDTYKTRLKDIEAWLEKEFAGIRTGQATPTLLDGIRVESYGSQMPLVQVGSVSIEDARTLRISPWDSSLVSTIEKAIRDADLGISVVSDSAGVRAVFPALTSERRADLVKIAKSKLEDARVSVRGVRDDVMKAIDAAQKASDISEDERRTRKEAVQKSVDAINRMLEQLFTKKEEEIAR